MFTCVCKKQFLTRAAISSHISRLRRTQPDALHWALRDDHDSSTVLAVPPPPGINAPPLASAAVLYNDVNNEVDVAVADDGDDGFSFGEDIDFSSMHDSVNTDPLASPGPANSDSLETPVPASATDEPDFSLVHKFNEYADSGVGNMFSTPAFRYDVQLLAIIMKHKANNGMFDDIKECVRSAALDGVDLIDTQTNRKWKAAITELNMRFDRAGSQPKTVEVELPSSKQNVNISLYDFKEQVYSLLSDPTVTMREVTRYIRELTGSRSIFT